MAQATIKMVTDSLDAFVRRDLTLAWSVIEYDLSLIHISCSGSFWLRA